MDTFTRRSKFALLCFTCSLFACGARAEPSPTKGFDADAVIRQLGDPNSRKRIAASEMLRTATSDGVRTALLEASRHDVDPEVRQRAARLLCDKPWALASDPAPVRITLSNYRTPLPEKRIEALAPLLALGPPALPAMMRLLNEEPSDDVRWALLSILRSTEDTSGDATGVWVAGGEKLRSMLRDLKPAPDDAPLLAAVGWGWQTTDPERAAPFFRQAVDVAVTKPADDHGEVDVLLKMLFARAVNRAEYADAVDLYRRHMWFTEVPAEEEAQNLFALYAQYGPQPGFERDVRTFESFFDQPEMMYVLGKLYAGRGERLAAQACYAAALAASVGDPEAREHVGAFLIGHQWYDLARAELLQALSAPGDGGSARDATVYEHLARCADALGDELQAASDMDAAAKCSLRGNANPLANLYAAMADWHRLRDAVDKADRPRVTQLADKLLSNGAWRSNEIATVDVDIDLVRALKSLERPDDAARVFKQAFNLLRLALDQAPHNAEVLNDIAWLCARAGEHLDDAYRWSGESIRLAPGNAAYLDTAAEVSAVCGKWDEAVARETAALKLQPGDRFMSIQLARFQAKGKKS